MTLVAHSNGVGTIFIFRIADITVETIITACESWQS